MAVVRYDHTPRYLQHRYVILLLKEKVSICLNSTDAYSKHNVWVLRPIGQDDLRSLYSTLFKKNGHPGLFFVYFRSFSSKHQYIFTTN